MRTNEKVTVLHELKDINVKVDYFWSADNKLINWNEQVPLPVGWIRAKVKIDLLEFTEHFEGLDKTADFNVCRLFINETFIGELLEAELKQTEHTEFYYCRVCVGHG